MPSLEEVLEQIEAGFYVVPEIQRSFIWRNTQIRDLVASIYNNFPIGAIIYWEIPDKFRNDYGDLFRPLAEDLPKENGRYMIIDGQQRLTSLLLVKRGEIAIRGRKRRINLFFNPIDEEFELSSKKIQKNPYWFNVTEVLNTEYVLELIEERADKYDPALRKNPQVRRNITKLRNVFETYEVHLIPAKLRYSEDFLSTFEKISRIFVNLNSKGTRIRMPDLALALLTAKVRKDIGTPFRQEFEEILKELENKKFPVDESVLIRLYLAIATGITRFNEAREELEKKEGQELLDFLSEVKKSINEAVNLLCELGIKSLKSLQSRYLLVPIAFLLYKEVILPKRIISEEFKEELSKWLILASQEKRYTGRLESELLEDTKAIEKGSGINGLMENLRMREYPFFALDENYENQHITMLLLLYQKLRTKDWNLDKRPRIPEIMEINPDDLHIHHIFPKEFLERRGYMEEWDNVANITIISESANKKIKFRDPKEYLKELYEVDPELLEKHFIPTDKELWDINRFSEFLKERMRLIINAIEKELRIKVIK